MVSGTWHYRGALRLGAVAAILALAGCSSMNPVHWYKHIVAPKPDATAPAPAALDPNTAANSEEPYPSLATVPPPATLGLTDAQRAALADGLIADRKNAKYAEEQAAASDAAPVPPMPPVFSPSPEPTAADTAVPDAMAPEMAAAPPRPAAVRKVKAKVKAKKPAAPSAVEQALAASGLSSGGPFDRTPPAPRESPEPDAAAAPPEAPSLPPVPVAPPTTAAPAAAQAPDAALPAAPALAAVPAAQAAVSAKPAAGDAAETVTTIRFAAGSTSLPADAAASLAPVAGVLAKNGGAVHVVSHAVSGGDASTALAAYQTALARAKAVKQGLVAAGIPESRITAEVSSSGTASDAAEVLVGK